MCVCVCECVCVCVCVCVCDERHMHPQELPDCGTGEFLFRQHQMEQEFCQPLEVGCRQRVRSDQHLLPSLLLPLTSLSHTHLSVPQAVDRLRSKGRRQGDWQTQDSQDYPLGSQQ